jgi:hypothetical protein
MSMETTGTTEEKKPAETCANYYRVVEFTGYNVYGDF